MKQVKIGTKIGFGFGVVVIITSLLGAVAVWSMYAVKAKASLLQKESVPKITVGNDVERSALLTMYEMRAYGLVGEAGYLERGRQHIADVKKHLEAARKLGASSASMKELELAAERASAQVAIYEALVQNTVDADHAIDKIREELNAAAKTFLAAAGTYQTTQYAKLADETKAGAPAEKLAQRIKKLRLVDEIIELGSACRVAVWKGQAERDTDDFEAAQKNFPMIKSRVDEILPITSMAVDVEALHQLQAAADSYQKAILSIMREQQNLNVLAQKRAEVANAVLAAAKASALQALGDATSVTASASSTLSQASVLLLAGLAVTGVMGAAIAFFLTRGVSRSITAVAEAISNGAEQTASAASQVASSSQTLASGSSQQAASVEEMSSSLEEMTSMTKRNAENAQQANDLAREANQTAAAGASDMKEMAAAMNDIKASSDDIAKIIKTIDEIAFQTNILALNAAVEAARAGEAGMGFAVVADEVRSLAQRSAVAAKETAAQIETAIAKTSLGVQLTDKVSRTLAEIVAKAGQVDHLAAAVATASKEQLQGITQINTGVTEIDKVTQGNAASAEESASAAEEMSAQTEALKEAVGELLAMVHGASASVLSAPARRAVPVKSATSHSSKVVKPELRSGGRRIEPEAPGADWFSDSRNGHEVNGAVTTRA